MRTPSGETSISATRISALDPVCGMRVDPSESDLQTDFQDETYYFCSLECLTEFSAHPQDFVIGSDPAADRSEGEAGVRK